MHSALATHGLIFGIEQFPPAKLLQAPSCWSKYWSWKGHWQFPSMHIVPVDLSHWSSSSSQNSPIQDNTRMDNRLYNLVIRKTWQICLKLIIYHILPLICIPFHRNLLHIHLCIDTNVGLSTFYIPHSQYKSFPTKTLSH